MSIAAALPPATRSDAALEALDDPIELARFTRWQSLPDGRREAISHWRLSGMHCAACAGIIESALQRVDGVLGAQVSAASERAEVRWDPQRTRATALLGAIRGAGYDAVPDQGADAHAMRQQEHRRSLWRLFVAGFCMMQVMMVATPLYFAAPGEIEPDQVHLLLWAAWLLSLPVLMFSAGPFFRGAWRSLRERRIGMDVPVALGIAVTFVASSGATFAPGGIFGHEVYFDSLTMFVFFLLFGRHLELSARQRVAASLEGALARLPDAVQRLDAEGGVEVVAVGRLRAGDHVRVLAGQAFPADGVLLEGRTDADEAMLTGESEPVAKQVGDAIVAGSVNLNAPVVMRVDRLGADTRYEGIVALMRGALTQRPPLVQQADRLAGPFLWGVLALAVAGAVAWAFIDPSRSVWVAVSVLIVTCPCALSLAAPSALLGAAGALARRGVLLRRLEAIEALARIDRVLFDKTGTLTREQLELIGTQALRPDVDIAPWRARAASLAALSMHPQSRALVEAVGAVPTIAWESAEEVAGQGVQARLPDGRTVRLGRQSWVGLGDQDAGVGNATCFGVDGRALLRFEFAEALRPEASDVLAQLRAEGVQVGLLSGDVPARVESLAARLGIADARAAMTPESKLAAVAKAQAEGHVVAMIGDGLNDAPVLARADVSFAFAHGAAVAQSGADAVLLGHGLGALAFARSLALRTVRVMRQNFAWAVAYNLTCIPLALMGWLPPWAAGIGMASSSLLVVLNSSRLLRPTRN
jgi:Cu2+-exporting ATPase